jgi:hypothetical protein
MRTPLASAVLLLTASLAVAQPSHTFEVASVKPSRPGTLSETSLDPAHFVCSGMTLLGLILSAYHVPAWRISGGAAWLSAESMADRFKMTFHRETRERPVYELVIAKGGPKLAPSTTGTYGARVGQGGLVLRHAAMTSLVSYLYTPQASMPQPVDRAVVDKTGLEGCFDLTLEWRPDTIQPADTMATRPSIFTALERAGLKLEPRKANVEFLVIDHAEKPEGN